MANSKKPIEKRQSIFEQERISRQVAIELLKQIKENEKARNNR